MGKRKQERDYDDILRKIRKIDSKSRKRRRSVSSESYEVNQDEQAKVNPRHQMLNSFFMTPTGEHELENIIVSLQNDKAPGIEGISNALLKEIKTLLVCL
ncbi:jg7399 [Pararge aegeria aegeria]|uniref:Jg7399 protein n=1 Tax=Pararge aegeria aegeria TaxID=348720 RepID=A0A8S4RSR3_9NEOP|nr:jg7399 [Pararge aegeria aegeria]